MRGRLGHCRCENARRHGLVFQGISCGFAWHSLSMDIEDAAIRYWLDTLLPENMPGIAAE
jgi:hypothetical protein